MYYKMLRWLVWLDQRERKREKEREMCCMWGITGFREGFIAYWMCSSKAPVGWWCLWTTPISFSSFFNIRLCFFTMHTYINTIHSPTPQTSLHPFQTSFFLFYFLPCSVGFTLSNALHPFLYNLFFPSSSSSSSSSLWS